MNHSIPELESPFWEELTRKTLDGLGGASLSRPLQKALEQDIGALQKLVHPETIYAECRIISLDEYIHTEAGPLESRMFSRLARRCSPDRSLILTITTMGSEFDEFCRLQKDLSRQFMLDAAGSLCVEMVADLFQVHVSECAKRQSKCISMRFSPGYCDWQVAGQRLIFNALDGSTAGVSLNDHDVMVPLKTISAATLVADAVTVKAPCCFCQRDGCPWRRLPFGRTGAE